MEEEVEKERQKHDGRLIRAEREKKEKEQQEKAKDLDLERDFGIKDDQYWYDV